MSNTRQQFLEAALLKIRSEIVEHKAIIDAYLESPLASIKDEIYFDQVVEHAKAMSVAENTYRVLSATYMPQPEPEAAAPIEGKTITEEDLKTTSSSYRKAASRKKKTTKKKEEE